MIKKYITVTGINTDINIVDGDREVNQGPVILLVLDKHLEVNTIFAIIKRNHPNAILVSNGAVSIVPEGIIMLESTEADRAIWDDHILGDQLAIAVTIKNCFYTKRIMNNKYSNTSYPIGHLHKVVEIVSAIS